MKKSMHNKWCQHVFKSLYIFNVINNYQENEFDWFYYMWKKVVHVKKILILRLIHLQIVVFFLNFKFDFLKFRFDDRFLFFCKSDKWFSTRSRLNVVNVSSTFFKFFFLIHSSFENEYFFQRIKYRNIFFFTSKIFFIFHFSWSFNKIIFANDFVKSLIWYFSKKNTWKIEWMRHLNDNFKR